MIFSFHLHFKESTICTKRHLVGRCVKAQQISDTTGKVQVANQGLLLVKIVDNKQKVVGQYKVIV